MTTWIEPPPPQEKMGCFARGCLILALFFIILCIAFAAGTYFAVRYLRVEYFPTTNMELPANSTTEQQQDTVRARWQSFDTHARAHEPARIELTADELNALIASDPKLRGKAFVSIDDNVARLQVSIPLERVRWLRGHYLNGECTVQSSVNGNPADARITSISVNGRPVAEEALQRQYGAWSFRRYLSSWAKEDNLKTFEVRDGKVMLESKSGD
ncbi:MAG: hypothetical protein QOG67_451 [Verrucomicrobiota bacterium]|jgi:hypothetical protein